MSVERSLSFEAWEELHRHGQGIADRLAQGFTGLIPNPPSFPWPPSPSQKSPFELDLGSGGILDIGSKLSQVGADFGAGLSGMVQQLFRQIPVPFRHEEGERVVVRPSGAPVASAVSVGGRRTKADGGDDVRETFGGMGIQGISSVGESNEDEEDDWIDPDRRLPEPFKRASGSVNISTTYDSRTQATESSFAARGDFWRVEASSGGSTSTTQENAPLFLVQLGPVLFVRDTTLLLPLHLSKQHLLWYGYDRKNGLHSLCPALWSKHRRWLLMSMICLNPLACSFMDLQFPNGQLTYVAGEGLTTSAFLPAFGGLIQAQGRFPGETKFSFSCKNKRGTRLTSMVQWPDNSFSLGIVHAMAWKRSGLIFRPTIQLSVCPTFGGSDPGLKGELIHSLKEELNLVYGYSWTQQPSIYTSLSLGRSKWNGYVGNSGAVIRLEWPLSNVRRPYFSIQLNGGFEF